MFDIAWSELAVIGAVALVVIGPKDLPKVMRTMGQWSRKMTMLTGEFRRHLDDMVRQAELDELKKKAEEAAAPFKSEMEGMGDFASDPDSLFTSNTIHPPEPPIDHPPEAAKSEPTTSAAAPLSEPVPESIPADSVKPEELKPADQAVPVEVSNSVDKGETRL